MATQHLTMPEARRFFLRELLAYQEHRAEGLTVDQAAAEMRIPFAEAREYEAAVTCLMKDLRKDLILMPPSGCRWCGIEDREHAQRWTKLAGWHGWMAPLPEQRKARLLALRAARMTTEDEAASDPARSEAAPEKAHHELSEGAERHE
ncbi:hypothetical protein [Actinoallomurus sp. CA-142502]|uniref:hypothetical protein n=1 Tax=Actinoallomurus sp. CA-142502 TaxID=3239885 RepID=UPI003D94E4BD